MRTKLALALHLPEEPENQRLRWWRQVAGGTPFDEVVVGQGSLAAWLWSRWLVLETAGLKEKEFVDLVDAYRRELWLWLLGDRPWDHCVAGLIGRLERRLAADGAPRR